MDKVNLCILLHDDDEIWSLNLSEAIPGRTLSIVGNDEDLS
jgi:hypothetical protein